MKYVNTGIVFQEIPDEVTLSINISNCPCHCIGCHSQYLWEDVGKPLNAITLNQMLMEYESEITCVCFMGGDAATEELNALAEQTRRHYPTLKIAWYSGRQTLDPAIDLHNFDFVKLGPYVESLGGLSKPTTNQRLYRIENLNMNDITSKFWK